MFHGGLGVHHDAAAPGQPHHHVRAALTHPRLEVKVHPLLHAGQLRQALQLELGPAPPLLGPGLEGVGEPAGLVPKLQAQPGKGPQVLLELAQSPLPFPLQLTDVFHHIFKGLVQGADQVVQLLLVDLEEVLGVGPEGLAGQGLEGLPQVFPGGVQPGELVLVGPAEGLEGGEFLVQGDFFILEGAYFPLQAGEALDLPLEAALAGPGDEPHEAKAEGEAAQEHRSQDEQVGGRHPRQ